METTDKVKWFESLHIEDRLSLCFEYYNHYSSATLKEQQVVRIYDAEQNKL